MTMIRSVKGNQSAHAKLMRNPISKARKVQVNPNQDSILLCKSYELNEKIEKGKENVYLTLTHCGMYLNQSQEAGFHSR